ncbi:MAG: acyl-CoA dehydrogenase family protein [Syntrophaceae bacterium]
MKLSAAQAGQVTGSFPYPRQWLDTQSEEIAQSIGKWSDVELIGKRLEYRENLEHQMRALTILSKDLGVDRFIWPEREEDDGFTFPEAASTLVRAYEEIGRGDAGLGFISAIKVALAAVLMENGRVDESLRKEINAVFHADKLELISLVMPGLGDISRGARPALCGREVQAELTRTKDGWSLNAAGARPLNSGANAVLYAVVASYPEGFALALVPASSPGIKKGKTLTMAGLKASQNADIDFWGVSLTNERVLPLERSPFQRLLTWIDLLCSAVAVGAGLDAYRIVRDWADNRVIKTGGLLKENTMDAAVLAQVTMDILLARIAVHSLGRAVAYPGEFGVISGDDLAAFAATVRVSVMEQVLHAINRAMEMMGSAGYAKEWNIEKHWRDVNTLKGTLGGRLPVEMDVARAYYGSTRI